MMIESGQVMAAMLANEIETGLPAIAAENPRAAQHWGAQLVIAHIVITSLVSGALHEEEHQKELLGASAGPLVNANGEPLNRQARRQIERKGMGNE